MPARNFESLQGKRTIAKGLRHGSSQRGTLYRLAVTDVAPSDKLFVTIERFTWSGSSHSLAGSNSRGLDVRDFMNISINQALETRWHLYCLAVHRIGVAGRVRVGFLEAADADGGHGSGRSALQ